MTGAPGARAGTQARHGPVRKLRPTVRGPVRELGHAVRGAAGTVWGTLRVLAWLGSVIIRPPRGARAAASAGPGDRTADGAPS